MALSIRQPWTDMILYNGKDIENRSWSTKYHGRILIHAAKGMTTHEWKDAVDFASRECKASGFKDFKALERGGIIGSVEIFDCVRNSKSPWFVGDFGFQLRDPRPLPFMLWKGQLKFFDVPCKEQ